MRNALSVVVGMFATFFGYSFFVPFLALYFQELGLSVAESAAWAGYTGFGQGLGFAISAPLWGMLADRIGRKPMVVRAMIASSGGFLLIPLFHNPVAVFVIILVRGFLAGPGTAAMALISASTPPRQMAMVVGWIEAAQVLGISLGLAAGAILAASIGIANTFLFAGAFGVLGATVVLFGAQEKFERPAKYSAAPTQGLPARFVGSLKQARSTLNPTLGFAFLAMGGVWMSQQGVGYIFILQVQTMADPSVVALYSGFMQSAFSVAMFVGVLLANRAGHRWGYRKVLFLGIVAASVLFIPQGLTGQIWVFALARAVQGFCTGLVSPLARALVALASKPEDRGTVFGLSGVFSGMGGAIGPLLFGSLLAVNLGVGPAIALAAVCYLPAVVAINWRGEIDALATRG